MVVMVNKRSVVFSKCFGAISISLFSAIFSIFLYSSLIAGLSISLGGGLREYLDTS